MSTQEPTRFRDDPNAPEGLRNLVDSARQAEPSRGAAERIAAGVQAHVGSPSGGEAASGSGSAGAGASGAVSGGAGASVGGATAARVGGLLLAATTLIGGGLWWASQSSQSSAPAQTPSSDSVARIDMERDSVPPGSAEPPANTNLGAAHDSGATTATGTSSDAEDAKKPTREARGETEADAPQAEPAQRQAQAEAADEPSARGRAPERREARSEARQPAGERQETQRAPAAEPARPSPEPSRGTETESEPSGPSEGQLLRRAQDALPAHPRQALQLTAEHARRFPDGHLVQEREVLAVEALVKLGRIARARSRAQRFLEEHPNTAHRTRLEALFEDEGGIHPTR